MNTYTINKCFTIKTKPQQLNPLPTNNKTLVYTKPEFVQELRPTWRGVSLSAEFYTRVSEHHTTLRVQFNCQIQRRMRT